MRTQGDSDGIGAVSPLLTKREAAAFCRVSLRTFERFVQARLPAVQIGARVFFASEDLQRWVDGQRSGVSTCERQAGLALALRRMAETRLSPQESEILAALRRRQHRAART